MAGTGTAPRCRSQVITLTDKLARGEEDEDGQADGADVLFKCLLYPVKELSGEVRRLITSTPSAARVVRAGELLQIGISNKKKNLPTTRVASSSVVG